MQGTAVPQPSLTAVWQPMKAMGAEAACLLVGKLDGTICDEQRQLPVELVARHNT